MPFLIIVTVVIYDYIYHTCEVVEAVVVGEKPYWAVVTGVSMVTGSEGAAMEHIGIAVTSNVDGGEIAVTATSIGIDGSGCAVVAEGVHSILFLLHVLLVK